MATPVADPQDGLPHKPVGPFPVLDAAWFEWLQHNLERGCSDEKLLAAMVRDRISAPRARQALQQARHLWQYKQQPGWTACSQPFLPSQLPNASVVDLGDRHAHLLMRLQRPDLALYDNVLSPDECEQLIELASGRLRRSRVLDGSGHGNIESEERTSLGRSLKRSQSPLVGIVEQRLATLCQWPEQHGEPLHVLHYAPGKQYLPHTDYFSPRYLASTAGPGGQRVATWLLYLNDVPAGGGTHFPHVGLTILPRRGCALYFAYTGPDSAVDTLSLHAGLPVEQGEKWLAVKWLRQHPYQRPAKQADPPAPDQP